MPGIVAVLEKRRGPDNDPRRTAAALAERLCRLEDAAEVPFDPFEGFHAKVVHGVKDYHGALRGGTCSLVWYGTPRYKEAPLGQQALSDLEAQWAVGSLSAWLAQVSGHYQLLAFRPKTRESFFACDKVSTHPLYYLETADLIAFTPEALSLKALKGAGFTGAIRQEAIFEFMASGHLWGDGTFWQEAKRLGPGQFIEASAQGLQLYTHWKMTYEPSAENGTQLRTRLLDAIEKDLKALPRGRGILTLSGGYDSRALLGLLDEAGLDFECVSYSFGEALSEDSDAGVGGYFAAKAGRVHHLHKAALDDPEALLSEIHRAIGATGGESDVVAAQDAFLGSTFYHELARTYDFIWRGDEVWGWSDHVVDTKTAFWHCYLFNLSDFAQPGKILKADAYQLARGALEARQRQLAGEYGGQVAVFDDLKDFLYWRHREARLLQNMAYYRRCYLPQFAPFLLDNTLSVIRGVPGNLRVRKKLFMEAMGERFPPLFQDEKAPTPYISPLDRFQALYQIQKVQECIRDCLLDNPPVSLSGFLDEDSLSLWLEHLLGKPPVPRAAIRSGYNAKRFLNNLLRRNQTALAWIKAAAAHLDRLHFPAQDSNFLFRLMVLSLALRLYESE